MAGSLDGGTSVYNTGAYDTCDLNESISVDTDWQLTNGQSDAILKMQAAYGLNTDLKGSLANLAARLAVRMAADGNIAQVDAEHDADGKHTFKLPHHFYQDNVAASQAAVAIPIVGPASGIEFEMPWAGSIVGISAQVANAEARTAGTLTVDATINGTVTDLQAVLDGTNTEHHSATQAIDTDAFSAGDRIGVKITTDAGWLPVSADVSVIVYVSFNG